MKTYTQEELLKVLADHALWLQGKPEGVGADLSGADLSGADLRSADLSGADLRGANFSCADLSGADLRSADLSGADLSGAGLSGADLRGANFSCADLRGANFSCADLSGADLRSADLSGAGLSGADLRGANFSCAKNLDPKVLVRLSVVPESGPFEVYKKLRGGLIATLYIPRSAGRVGGLERKCRVEKGKVKRIQRADGTDVTEGVASHDGVTKYVVGQWVKPDKFNPDPMEVCTNGIHCFITRLEAEEYE